MGLTLSVKNLMIGVNKMDSSEPSYSEASFEQMKKEVFYYIEKIDYNSTCIAFVPILVCHGDNLLEHFIMV